MADTSFAVTAGSGTDLHTVTTSIGGSTVHDQVIKHGEPYLATYVIASAGSVSIATAADHVVQIMAGSTLNVYIRRIRVFQTTVATAAAMAQLHIFRLTTAGTGGTSITPAPIDTTDSAAGATAMTLPTAKGTESTRVGMASASLIQTNPTGGPGNATLLADWNFDQLRTKGLRIAAGTSNGIAVKTINAHASANVNFEIVIAEANF